MAYDRRLVSLHKFVRDHTKFPAVIDTQKELFAPNSCPEAALYVGWYSPSRYIPCCLWTRGAVGWHIASFEAAHLHNPRSTEWAVGMIHGGVVATVAGVNEPYLAPSRARMSSSRCCWPASGRSPSATGARPRWHDGV